MDFEAQETQVASKKICIIAGITLLALGIIFSFWILALINGVFRSPDRVALIRKMLSVSTEEQSIRGQLFESNFDLTFGNFLGYLGLLIICGILLAAAGRIIAAFLVGGIEALGIAAGVPRERKNR